ncbi:MAG: GNAT family N-acetyltransferase [Cyclobacteriaceae bacterium]|nr:GNAT family N-acetyltransferase [Cyclobacteriaceae bacterium]
MSVQIFEATTRHAEPIARLLFQMGYPDDVQAIAQRIEENQRPGYKTFVAEVNRQVVGVIVAHTYTYLHAAGLTGRIMTFCVDETVRGQGVGTQLLYHAEAYLAGQKCVKVELNCNNRRTETHVFYQQRGYTQTSLHFVKRLN